MDGGRYIAAAGATEDGHTGGFAGADTRLTVLDNHAAVPTRAFLLGGIKEPPGAGSFRATVVMLKM